MSSITKRIKKELAMRETFKQGYPRLTASRWYNAVMRDNRQWKGIYSQEVLDRVHSQGFLAKNIERLGLLEHDTDRITDLDYLYLRPFNNSFSKWIEDINTMTRMHPDYAEHFPEIYFSVSNRNGLKILDFPVAKRKCGVRDIIAKLRELGKPVQLRPAYWNSKDQRFEMEYCDETHVTVNGKELDLTDFYKLLAARGGNYLLCEQMYYDYPLTEGWKKNSFFRFYLINDTKKSYIACAVAEVYEDNSADSRQFMIDMDKGTFVMDGTEVAIPNWAVFADRVLDLARSMEQLDYFTVIATLTEGGFKVLSCNYAPYLPRIPINAALNDYLKERLAQKKAIVITPEQKHAVMKRSLFAKFVRKFCRRGIRPYMQGLWFRAVRDDLKWSGTNIFQKIWCWKRGFLSYRIDQYGITKDNYKTFLSDYDYHWLNRINNVYQTWISDKTTFRYTMEPMKEYIPAYYLSIFKRNGEVMVSRMPDCPENVDISLKGAIDLLRQEKILVFKPSAGLHGDGFYCLEYREDKFWINGKPTDAQGIEQLIREQRSVYVITSYIHMHSELKKIYPTSVNSIRIMAINRHGYDPAILQTYMRIGSSKTGYTDNVGYGGICSMIDIESGELYDPESLRDHVYYPCPKHPDTGTEIAGIVVPHWPLICQKVGEVCQMFPELEYLGFDVAVMEDGFQIMEINVHQDLHKVGRHTQEIRDYYNERIAYKKKLNGIK